MGGECNYKLRVGDDYRLEFVSDAAWKSECMLRWSDAAIQRVLSNAEALLLDTAKHLRLPVKACPALVPPQSHAFRAEHTFAISHAQPTD